MRIGSWLNRNSADETTSFLHPIENTVEMTIDWSRYPGLPEPPVVPEWRDTPEREAYWREHEAIPDYCHRKTGWLLLMVLDVVLTLAILFILKQNYKEKALFSDVPFSGLVISCLAIALEMLIPSFLIWFVIMRLLKLWRELLLARKYGFWILRLRRPDVSREIAAILDARPSFDRQAFLAMWPTPKHAECAARLLDNARDYWKPVGMMLYPNDPVLFFFFGRRFPFRKARMIEPPGDFWDDLVWDLHASNEIANIDKSSTLAELVECLTVNK